MANSVRLRLPRYPSLLRKLRVGTAAIAFKDMEFEVAVAAVLVKRYGLSVEAAALRMGIEPEAIAIALCQTTE